MTEVITPGYKGPERRKTFVVTDTCPCHTKHDSILRRHESELESIRREDHKVMWDDIKSRTPLRVFIVAVLIFAGIAGFTYKKVHDVDIKAEKQIVRGEIMQESLGEIKQSIDKVNDKMDTYINEWKQTNGKGGTQ